MEKSKRTGHVVLQDGLCRNNVAQALECVVAIWSVRPVYIGFGWLPCRQVFE